MNSAISFKLAIAVLVIIAGSFAIDLFLNMMKIYRGSVLMTAGVIGAIAVSLIGNIYSIKSLKEENTGKKIIGVIVNFGFVSFLVVFFFYLIIENALDINRLFNEN